LSICNLVGSTFFISTVVQVLVVRAAQERKVKVTPIFFIRDLIFYVIMMIYLLIVMLVIKHIDLLISIGFLVLYGIYVVLVVI